MQERKRHPGRMGIHRADPNTLQNIPLPIYPRSLGNFLVPGDYVELVPAGTKNFVQFFWCVDGEGEFELEGTPVTVRAGDCFYHLPMEPHVHRAHSNLWEYRWVAFDGPFAREFMLSYQYPRAAFHAGACPHELFLELETWVREMSPYSWRQMVAVICALLARAGGRNDDTTRGGTGGHRGNPRSAGSVFSAPDLNVNRLADELAMDRSTLRRIFQSKNAHDPVGLSGETADPARALAAGADPAAAGGGGGPLRIFRRQLLLPGDPPRRRRQPRQLPGPLTFSPPQNASKK